MADGKKLECHDKPVGPSEADPLAGHNTSGQ
jgi:hypothetical protein